MASVMIVTVTATWMAYAAAAQQGPTVTVTPDTGLTGGQSVSVHYEGFTTSQVKVRQCKAGATDFDWCSFGFTSSIPDANGSGTYTFDVQVGVVNTLRGPVTCDATNPCAIGVADFGSPPRLVAFAGISFASSATTTTAPPTTQPPSTTSTTQPPPVTTPPNNQPPCPIPSGQLFRLGGSAAANQVIKRWEAIVCQPSSINVPLDYTANNSPDGRTNMLQGSIDIALSGSGFTKEDTDALSAAGKTPKDFIYIPLTATGLEVNARYILGGEPGAFLTSIFLTPEAAAWAFKAEAFKFSNEPEFASAQANNRNFDAAPTRFADSVVRADHSTDNLLLTSWLYSDQKAVSIWERDLASGLKGPSENMPSRIGVNLRAGAPQAAQRGRAPNENATYISQFTVMDSSLASIDDDDVFHPVPNQSTSGQMARAWLQNPDGSFVPPDPTSITKGLDQMKDNGDGTYSWVFTKADGWNDPGGYPLPHVTYAIVPKDLGGPAQAWAKAFFTWAVTDGQKPENLPPGYVPLPPRMVAQAQKQIQALPTSNPATTTTTTAPAAETSDELADPGDGLVSGGDLSDTSGLTTSDGNSNDLASSNGSSTGADFSSSSSGITGAGAGAATAAGGGGEQSGPAAATRRILATLLSNGVLSPLMVGLLGLTLVLAGPAVQWWDRRRQAPG